MVDIALGNASAPAMNITLEQALSAGDSRMYKDRFNGCDLKWKPLSMAVSTGRVKIVEALLPAVAGLGRRCDLNLQALKDGNGRTVFHLAAKYRHLAILQLIIRRISSISDELALWAGAASCIQSSINCVDYCGESALHVAVERGWQEGAELLIQHGVDINLLDRQGITGVFRCCDTERFVVLIRAVSVEQIKTHS